MRKTLNYTRPHRFLHAFTLVELLVVIAIIALLLSILMPSLRKVREQTKRLVCKTRLKQMGLGMTMYVDSHGVYPPVMLYPATIPPLPDSWMGWRGAYYTTWETLLIRSNCLPGPSGSRDAYGLEGGTDNIWLCPSEQYPLKNGSPCPIPPFRHFAINGGMVNPLNMGKIKNTASTLLLAGIDPLYEYIPRMKLTYPGIDPGTMYYRHGGKSNVLFFDCHVGDVSPKTPGVDDPGSSLWRIVGLN